MLFLDSLNVQNGAPLFDAMLSIMGRSLHCTPIFDSGSTPAKAHGLRLAIAPETPLRPFPVS